MTLLPSVFSASDGRSLAVLGRPADAGQGLSLFVGASIRYLLTRRYCSKKPGGSIGPENPCCCRPSRREARRSPNGSPQRGLALQGPCGSEPGPHFRGRGGYIVIYYLYEFGGYFDAYRKKIRHFDQQPFDTAAAYTKQFSLASVQRTAYDTDRLAIGGRRQLSGKIIFRIFRSGDGLYESLHVVVRHEHGLAITCAFAESVLKGRDFLDDRVEFVAPGICEQQVSDDGLQFPLTFPVFFFQTPTHGGENLDVLRCKAFVCRMQGIGPFQIAQDVPTPDRVWGGKSCHEGSIIKPIFREKAILLFLHDYTRICISSS